MKKGEESTIIISCARPRVSAKEFSGRSKLQKNLLEVEIAEVAEQLLEGKLIKEERL